MERRKIKDYDTVYIFIKGEITGGKAVSQTAHAVGRLASEYPYLWEEHVKNGNRAVALKCDEFPSEFPIMTDDSGEFGKHQYGNVAYASVFDKTDNDVFALAILPQQRLNMPKYDIL